MGRDAAQPAPARATSGRSTSPRRSRCPASTRSSPTRTCPGRKVYGMEIPDQPVLAWDAGALPGRGDRARRRRPPGDRPPRGRRDRGRLRGARAGHRRRARDGRRRAAAAPVRQHAAPRRHRPRRPGRDRRRRGRPASTRSGCRTRRSSARSRASRCPAARTAASTSTSPRSGCTSTATRSPRASTCRPRRCASRSRGVGGAFGGREDLSMQIHACLLALHTGRPVKMVYRREESFFGHVHRHPARMRYEHGATQRRRLVYVRARIVLDGGAYASSSTAVCANAACFALRPVRRAQRADRRVRHLHEQPAVRRDARLRRRAGGFAPRGADGQARGGAGAWTRSSCASATRWRPAAACRPASVDPRPGAGRRAARAPARDAAAAARHADDLRELPGGVSNTTHGEGVRRGVGYAVGFKNVGFSEGFDDYSTARVRLSMDERRAAGRGPHGGRRGRAGPDHRAGADRAHRARRRARRGAAGRHARRLGRLVARPRARRYMTGGAVKAACEAVRERLHALAAERGVEPGRGPGRGRRDRGDARVPPPRDVPAGRDGQGDAHVHVRVLRPPRGGRRRHRARPRARGRDRHHAGRRQGDQPAGARRPDRGRHRAGPRARADGGDPGARRQGA